jgi:hypothetical protein
VSVLSLRRARKAPLPGSRSSAARRAEEEPFRRLWLAVIRLAFRDLDAASATLRREARDFLRDEDHGLSTYAQLAGLCPRQVRREARRILGEGVPGAAPRPEPGAAAPGPCLTSS